MDTKPTALAPPDQGFSRRLLVACLVSIIFNAALWMTVSGYVRQSRLHRPEIIQISRIILKPPPTPKTLIPHHRPVETPPHPTPVHRAPPPPVAMRHIHIMAAPPAPSHSARPAFTVPVDHTPTEAGAGIPTLGRGRPGVVSQGPAAVSTAPSDTSSWRQDAHVQLANQGEAHTAPRPRVIQAPSVPLEIAPSAPAAPSLGQPQITQRAPAAPEAPISLRAVIPPPEPVGPSQAARPVEQVKPDFPDDLRAQPFRSSVHVRVEIDANGASHPVLRGSSGSAEIDRCVLQALKQWKWKPALKNGIPVASSQLFKFNFVVQ